MAPAVHTAAPPTYLDTAAVADLLGVQPRTLEDWRRRGGGPPYIRLSATCVRYASDAVTEWLRERTASSTAEEAARSEVSPRAASGDAP